LHDTLISAFLTISLIFDNKFPAGFRHKILWWPFYWGTGDKLRIPEICQNRRYAKKTQLSLDPKKYRYVGVMADSRQLKKP
jgi:hypothetical protein